MDDFYTILTRYFSGEATAEEAIAVEKWKAASPENKKLFTDLFKLSEASSHSESYQLPDAKNAWSYVQQSSAAHSSSSILSKFNLILKTVAIIGSAALITWFLLPDKKTQNQGAKQQQLIFQNNNHFPVDTSLQFARIFADSFSSIQQNISGKELVINGGFFFTPINNEFKQTIIKAGNAEITTKSNSRFFISYDSLESTGHVYVKNGELLVKYAGKEVLLTDSQSVKLKDGEIVKIKPDLNSFSYTTKIFDFNNTSLAEAVQLLNKAYAVKIELEDKALNNCRFTAYFDNKTLKEVLEIITFTLNLNYKFADARQHIIISGKGCSE